MRYCGMDVSDRSSTIHIIDEEGKSVHRGVVFNDSDGIRQFFGRQEPLRVGLEACGTSAYLAREIAKYQHEVRVLHPQAIEALTKGRKTDENDATMLAQVLRGGWYREVHQKSDAARVLRALVGVRAKCVEIQTQLANEIQGYLKHWGRPAGSSTRAQFGNRVRGVLAHLPDLGAIIEPLLESWEEMRRRVAEYDRQIVAKLKEGDEGKVAAALMTHDGVGPVTAAAFLGTIDDPSRFHASRQVGAYVGLTARVSQSGATMQMGRITRHGDPLLRSCLRMAAHVLLTKGGESKLKTWGLKLAKRRGYGKAKVAVARRIAVNLHRMMIEGKPFDPARG